MTEVIIIDEVFLRISDDERLWLESHYGADDESRDRRTNRAGKAAYENMGDPDGEADSANEAEEAREQLSLSDMITLDQTPLTLHCDIRTPPTPRRKRRRRGKRLSRLDKARTRLVFADPRKMGIRFREALKEKPY